MRILFIWMTLFGSISFARGDVHFILYATWQGKTGHCGIAVDDYSIRVIDEEVRGKTTYRFDSIRTGTVVYYDLWPYKDEYKGNYEGDIDPVYYKLPSTHYKQWISLKTLADQGIPHKLGYGCDGIISITSSTRQDLQLIRFLDQVKNRNQPFNAMHYNCCDFVAEALSHLTGRSIEAKEFIIKNYASTPNKLYKVLAEWPDVKVIKDPGEKVNGYFFQERIIKHLRPILTVFQLFITIPGLT